MRREDKAISGVLSFSSAHISLPLQELVPVHTRTIVSHRDIYWTTANMNETPSRRESRDVSPIAGADARSDVRSDPRRVSIRSDDSLTHPAFSVSTSLMTEEHTQSSTTMTAKDELETAAECATLQRT